MEDKIPSESEFWIALPGSTEFSLFDVDLVKNFRVLPQDGQDNSSSNITSQ
jgi:hypothetical protein